MSAWKVETRRHESGHVVHLVVGTQSFSLPSGDGSHDEATWWAEQLRSAILAIERGVLEEVCPLVCHDCKKTKPVTRDEIGRFWHKPPTEPGFSHRGEGCDAATIRTLITSRLPSCSGCAKPDGGTHQEGTKEHP